MESGERLQRETVRKKKKERKFTKKASQMGIKYVLQNYYVESAKSV